MYAYRQFHTSLMVGVGHKRNWTTVGLDYDVLIYFQVVKLIKLFHNLANDLDTVNVI